MSKLSILGATLAALVASPAEARRARRTSRLSVSPPPPSTGDYSRKGTFHQASSATCNATVSADTEAQATSALVDVYVDLFRGFCSGFDVRDPVVMDQNIKAVAKLALESKIKCTTSGKFAMACGGTWARASSYAGAAFRAYATAWSKVQDDGECSCARDLFAESEVTVSAFGDIWATIYSALDDYACATSMEFDDLPSAVEQTKLVECTSRVVYNVWAKASAEMWVRSSCDNDKPARCETCCVSDEGSPLPDCDCEAWQQQCHETASDWAKAIASAEIKGKQVTNTASCEGSLIDELEDDADAAVEYFSPVFTHNNTVNDACANANAKCIAFTKAEATAEAVSAQAMQVNTLAASICKVPTPATPTVIAEAIQLPATAIAEATAEVYAKASAQCWISDKDEHGLPCLDPMFDGGCAYARTWVEAYSSACAEAIAVASANITFGNQPAKSTSALTYGYAGSGADCDCNLGGEAFGFAMASEIETIHAYAVSTVEAEACTDGVLWSEVAQRCMAKSVAELYAKAVAKVLLRNKCVSADKASFCEGKCETFNAGTEWEECIDRCTQRADAEATALVEAIATLDLTTTESCSEPVFEGIASFQGITETTTLKK